MSLKGKLVSHTELKSNGDLFYDLFKSTPHHLCNISPNKIESCDLLDGSFGTVGSVLFWHYTVGEEKKVSKDIVEAIDEENKMVRFKIIGGENLKLYKNMAFSVEVDTKGVNHVVTWTIEYEKVNLNVPEPHVEMEFHCNLTKEIEAYHLK